MLKTIRSFHCCSLIRWHLIDDLNLIEAIKCMSLHLYPLGGVLTPLFNEAYPPWVKTHPHCIHLLYVCALWLPWQSLGISYAVSPQISLSHLL